MPQSFERVNDISGAFGEFDLKCEPAGPAERGSGSCQQARRSRRRYDNVASSSMKDPSVQTSSDRQFRDVQQRLSDDVPIDLRVIRFSPA
jgi:hypothetical protein